MPERVHSLERASTRTDQLGFPENGSTGKWSLDDKQDEEHIVELQRQLSACKSIFSWVQAWNIYVARFLSNNFGEPANCLGRPHNDIAFSRSRFHPTSTVVDSFMLFDEYVAYTEETSQHLRDAYTELLDPPTKEMVEFTPEIDRAEWTALGSATREYYDDRMYQLYGGEIIRKYGGLAMGEKRLLPIELVTMLRGEKVRWQG